MTAREAGFLLLTSCLGDPDRRVLTPAQLRTLSNGVKALDFPREDRELTIRDLAMMGCSRPLAERVLMLLSQEDLLWDYLNRAKQRDCVPVTRLNRAYPDGLRTVLGSEAPGSLWVKGDLSLLEGPMISLVGSRELHPENSFFAAEVGRQAALQGYTLVSGNARGADRTAQDACLFYGGKVVSIVADALESHRIHQRIVYVSEEGFDLEFSARRALQRNRLIHSLGQVVLVAQCRMGKGGTWSGTVENLRHNRRPVCIFADGSPAARELEQLGARLIPAKALGDLCALHQTSRLI